MSELNLYKICVQKIAISSRDGIYKARYENPFSAMPSKFVNDIMSATLNLQRASGLRADGLEKLLMSGKLRELRISERYTNTNQLKTLIKVLHFLKSGCQELEIFHLKGAIDRQVRSQVSEGLEKLFINCPNLKDLHCCFRFDLKALRNCKKLRSMKLNFWPRQHWYEFLAKEKTRFQSHKYLEFFTICQLHQSYSLPYADIEMILRFCPALVSLGFIETSQALSQLNRQGIPPSILKLKHCYWRDKEYDLKISPSHSPDHRTHRVQEAITYYSAIEELDFDGCCLRSIPYLRSLQNLVLLNITVNDNVSWAAVNDVLQVIGPQLKHLSFETGRIMNLSLLLQNCHNLESLRIRVKGFTQFANTSVILPKLQRLTFSYLYYSARLIFRLFCECHQLTELFLLHTPCFDDQSLYNFLENNSLSNLTMACFSRCGLTERGFREFLLHTPELEKIEISSMNLRENNFQRIISETNHKALCNKGLLSDNDEFFQKRSNFYES